MQEPHGLNLELQHLTCGLPGGSAGKESACIAGNLGSIPVLGRSPGEGKGHPLQYSGLENSMGCMDHGATESRTRLNNFHFQMPAGILTGAGGTTHPCHLFSPKTQALPPAYPVLCPPLPSSSRLYFLGTPGPCLCPPSPRASGISAPSSSAAPECRDLPRNWGGGLLFMHICGPVFKLGGGGEVRLQFLWLPPRRNPLIAGEVRALCIAGICWTVMI